MMKKIVLALCVIGVATAQENFKDCLEQDSISCVQMTVRTITGLPSHFFDNWMKVGMKIKQRRWTWAREEEKKKKTSKKNKNIIIKESGQSCMHQMNFPACWKITVHLLKAVKEKKKSLKTWIIPWEWKHCKNSHVQTVFHLLALTVP